VKGFGIILIEKLKIMQFIEENIDIDIKKD